jgi:hypothetical protein
MPGFLSNALSIAKKNVSGVGAMASAGAAQSAALGSAFGTAAGNALYGGGAYLLGGGAKNALMLYLMVILMHLLDFFVWGFTPNHLRVLAYVWIIGLMLWMIGDKNKRIGTTVILIFAAMFNSVVSMIIFGDYNFLKISSFSLNMYTIQTLLSFTWYIVAAIIILIILRKTNQSFDMGFVVVFLYIVAFLPYVRGWAFVWDLLASPYFGTIQTFIEIFLYIIPALWWFLGSRDIHPPRFLSIIMNIVLVALFAMFIFSNASAIAAGGNQALLASGIDSTSLLRNVGDLAANSWEQGRLILTSTANNTRNQFNTELARAQGKDFESDVERANLRSVGLSLGDIQISPIKPRVGDILTFSSRLEVLSFDTPIPARANCTIANNAIKPPFFKEGDMIQSEFFIRDYANNFIVCRLERDEISEQRAGYTVNMTVEFDYAASAYLQRYFLKPGLIRTLPTSGVMAHNPESAFFSFYGLGSPPRQSVRTIGPVDLAIRTPNIIVELEESIDQSPFLIEVGLESARVNWKGELKEVHQIILSIPKDFEVLLNRINSERFECNDGGTLAKIEVLTGPSCSAFRPAYEFPDLNCDHYDHVVFTPTNTKVAKDIVVSCYIKPRDVQSLLDSANFAQVSFQARAAYKYQLQQTKVFSVDAAPLGYEPIKIPSLESDSICGDAIRTQAKFDYSKRFSVSNIRQDYERVLTILNSNNLTDSERRAYNDADCHTRLIAQSLILNDFDILKPFLQFGRLQLPGSYGPLRMNTAQFDDLVRRGVLDLDTERAKLSTQPNQQTTQSGSTSTNANTNTNTNSESNTQSSSGTEVLEADAEESQTSTQTQNTENTESSNSENVDENQQNQDPETTQTQTSSQQNTQATQNTQQQNQPLTLDQKNILLREYGFAYSLAHIDYLVKQCKEQTPNGFDPSCVIGKFNCGQNFIWGDLNSCTSFDTCRLCMNTYVPAVYSYYREIAHVTNDGGQRVNQGSSQSQDDVVLII